MNARSLHLPPNATPPSPDSRQAPQTSPSLSALKSATQHLLSIPFDALRHQYAAAVIAGVAQRSLRASGRWERFADGLEKLTLGPLARQR